MADKSVPLDVAQQAIRISEMESVLALQTQGLRTAVENMTNTLSAVQAETRAIVASVHELALQQATNQRDREAINELKKDVVDLSSRLEDFFTDFESRNSDKWREHERNRDEWRAAHERGQAKDLNEVVKEVNRIDRSLVFSRGYIMAVIGLASVLVGGFLWALNQQFDRQAADINRLIETAQYNRSLIDQQRDKQHSIELHLARGAREPYIVSSEEGSK